MVTINGSAYYEFETDKLPTGDMCTYCDFYGTDCFDRRDFSCHADSRDDGRDVVFIKLIDNPR